MENDHDKVQVSLQNVQLQMANKAQKGLQWNTSVPGPLLLEKKTITYIIRY